jgi:hypothetical protein
MSHCRSGYINFYNHRAKESQNSIHLPSILVGESRRQAPAEKGSSLLQVSVAIIF